MERRINEEKIIILRFVREYERRNIKIGENEFAEVRSFKYPGMAISNKWDWKRQHSGRDKYKSINKQNTYEADQTTHI